MNPVDLYKNADVYQVLLLHKYSSVLSHTTSWQLHGKTLTTKSPIFNTVNVENKIIAYVT